MLLIQVRGWTRVSALLGWREVVWSGPTWLLTLATGSQHHLQHLMVWRLKYSQMTHKLQHNVCNMCANTFGGVLNYNWDRIQLRGVKGLAQSDDKADYSLICQLVLNMVHDPFTLCFEAEMYPRCSSPPDYVNKAWSCVCENLCYTGRATSMDFISYHTHLLVGILAGTLVIIIGFLSVILCHCR